MASKLPMLKTLNPWLRKHAITVGQWLCGRQRVEHEYQQLKATEVPYDALDPEAP